MTLLMRRSRVDTDAPKGAVALAHDYLTQRGGAERVAGVMAKAFPSAPMYTTLYDPNGTFPEIADIEVRSSPLNRRSVLRSHHRLALPFLAGTVSKMTVDADVLVTSSSGWAHGISCTGRKVVYCHAPARWLYQEGRYLDGDRAMLWEDRIRRRACLTALEVLAPRLREWDRRAAATADRYLVNSTVTQKAVREIYGIEAEVLPPPPALGPGGEETPVGGIETPFLLCVARLLPYKNVDAIIAAARKAGVADLVIVGHGPDRPRLKALAAGSSRIHLLDRVSDAQLRWLYRNCLYLVAASYEDYGLSPLEAAAFGRPTLALRAGGFLDTVVEGQTGAFFDEPTASAIAEKLQALADRTWDDDVITAHAESFAPERFMGRLRSIVEEELALT